MRLSQHFTLEEFTTSATAKKLGISNQPTPAHIANMQELCDKILEPLRATWGAPVFISSGYRGYKLNKAVKGSSTSAHCYGLAADLIPGNGDIKAFKNFVRTWLHRNNIAYDQYIDEKKGSSEWVHIGIKNRQGKQRRQDLYTTNGISYNALPKWNDK